ncbi:hypothetical protein [Micromonospora sp. NPDC002575]|uniref:hypothetical protein n=1 Tax=Micromonospora sp. NPDC002575 TaxID=3364222 RepID=UPI0036A124BF
MGGPAQASEPATDPDAGSIGIQLLEAPANRREDPRARRYIVDHLPPGATIHRQVLVKNDSDNPQHIEVYPAAASISKGEFQFGEGRETNELTSWVSLDRPAVDLKPHTDARVRVTITVPPDASRGERYGVIWAQVTPKPDPNVTVRQVRRVGIRMYLDIGPGGEPPSDFTIGEMTPARDNDGIPTLGITVRNTGERALDITGSANLSDGPAGMHTGPFNVAQGATLAPGTSGTVTIRFPRDLPNGPWKAEVHLQSGLVRKTAASQVTFPPPGQVGASSRAFKANPWLLAGIPLGVGLVITAGLIMIVRPRHRAAVARLVRQRPFGIVAGRWR